MAKWAYKVDFKDFYHKYPDDITIQELAEGVVRELNKLLEKIRQEPMDDFSVEGVYREEFLELADDLENDILFLFEEIRDDDSMDENDFANAMEELYDWADTSLDGKFGGVRMCWVNTL